MTEPEGGRRDRRQGKLLEYNAPKRQAGTHLGDHRVFSPLEVLHA